MKVENANAYFIKPSGDNYYIAVIGVDKKEEIVEGPFTTSGVATARLRELRQKQEQKKK